MWLVTCPNWLKLELAKGYFRRKRLIHLDVNSEGEFVYFLPNGKFENIIGFHPSEVWIKIPSPTLVEADI